MDPIGRAIARTGLTPNMITTAGFLGNAGAAAVIARGELLWGGAIMLAASALDLFDGAVARATGQVTRFGAVFDAVFDRLSEAAILLGLLLYFTDKGNSRTEVVLTYAAVVGSMMVSYVRARAESHGFELAEGFFRRQERVAVLGIGLLFDVMTPVLWVLAIATNLTALQRLYATYRKAN